MWSLTNSFKRLALFLNQKLEEINAQRNNEENERQKREAKNNDNSEAFNKYVLCSIPLKWDNLFYFRQNLINLISNSKQRVNQVHQEDEKILADIDDEEEVREKHNIEITEDEHLNDVEDEDEESMSLKDVIMTLNDFYATKLESLFKLIDNMDALNTAENSIEIEKIEKI